MRHQHSTYTAAFVALLVLLAAGCTDGHKRQPDPSVAPLFVKPAAQFEANCSLIFMGTDGRPKSDIIESMLTQTDGQQPLSTLVPMLEPQQALIVTYTDERRRTLSMSDIGQQLDVVFANAAGHVVHTAPSMPAYSTQKFSSYEYAKYVIFMLPDGCNGFKASDTDRIVIVANKK